MKKIIFVMLFVLGALNSKAQGSVDVDWSGLCSNVYMTVYAVDNLCGIIDNTAEYAYHGTGNGPDFQLLGSDGSQWMNGAVPAGVFGYVFEIYTKCPGGECTSMTCPCDLMYVSDVCGYSTTACMTRTCDLCGTSNDISATLTGSYNTGYSLSLTQ